MLSDIIRFIPNRKLMHCGIERNDNRCIVGYILYFFAPQCIADILLFGINLIDPTATH